jgi:hypothetical protein
VSGNILNVQLIDLPRLIYQYDERRGVAIRSKSSEGSFTIASLTQEQVRPVEKVIREEQAPKDGVERCQDWVLRTIISLEAEELVPPGTSAWIERLVGQSAQVLARSVGERWTTTESSGSIRAKVLPNLLR